MPKPKSPVFNIAIVGGGNLCKEVLEKTTFKNLREEFLAPITAVVDTDLDSPGMTLARKLNLLTFSDYRSLYKPQHHIHLIIVLAPEKRILEDILETRPPHIRILARPVFELFWKTISMEARLLRERSEELTTILNGIQDFILVITPNLDIVDANESFLKQMGYTREDVIGRKCYEVFQKVDHQCNDVDIVCPLNEVIRNKRPSQKILTRFDQNGELRYFELNIHPVWESDGKISKFIEISRDITDRLKEEAEISERLEQMVEERTRQLKETHVKLLHKDKMASLGKLSASVVHEINNPLAGVLNLVMLMKRIVGEDPISPKEIDQFSQYLSLMETETRRMSRIVSNLLAFSRQSKMELKNINLNRLIEKTLFLNANLLKIHRVKVETHLAPDLPEIVGSEDQLQQVFMNLISNAAEAIEPQGSGDLKITTGYSLEGGIVNIYLQNTGMEIAQENMSRIFEPFFTTKKKGKGVGLGLSVAYGIIQEHGGTIYVISAEGTGTTFRVNLPLKRSSDTILQ
jgi:PAS domain S-box-containing protein